jgi:hypothetical protein
MSRKQGPLLFEGMRPATIAASRRLRDDHSRNSGSEAAT